MMECKFKQDSSLEVSSCAFVGKRAPPFTLDGVNEKNEYIEVNIADFQKPTNAKNVLLMFYPGDFTFVCPSEIIAIDKSMKEFESKDTVVFAISPDSKYVHNAWRVTPASAGGIGPVEFTLLSDSVRKVAAQYGVLDPDTGVIYRGTFIIDKKGILQHISINNLGHGRSIEEILRIIDAMNFTASNPDVCPANWKKGMRPMKPTKQGVADYMAQQQQQQP